MSRTGIALVNKNDKHLAEEELKVGYITYQTLAERVGDMILCNNIANRIDTLDLEQGEFIYYEDSKGNRLSESEYEELDYEEQKNYHEYNTDIFQYYIISDSGASYLVDVAPTEIIYYDMELDIYVWAITHFGTPWSGVYTDVKATDNIQDLFD